MSMPGAGSAQPPLTPSEERTWALVAHIGTFLAAWFAMGFLCPLVIYLIYRYRSDFVRRHALESLNFQLSLLIYGIVAVLLSVITLGLGLLIVIPIILIGAVAAVVVIVMATFAASNGREYRYPLTIRLVR
ncbi:MAG TPA: DUF4870 domain-containing protein [Kribbella sp.]|nr:DUF4870 domain-containing protein [Kribbella sp.]